MVKLNLKLPEHFLEEEVRDKYTVSVQMKKVWAIELDLLNEFMRVCEKYDIKFLAAGGTILGAVRHKGFIPWDDDIDVMMLRSEYIRLCEVAQKEFRNPYFFQTEETDPGSYRGHAQLRNSETTGILKAEMYQKKKINQGIFIDIFPLDCVPDNPRERKVFLRKLSLYQTKFREELSLLYPFHFELRKNLFAMFFKIFKYYFNSRSVAAQKANEYYWHKEDIITNNVLKTHTLLMSPIYEERFVYDETDVEKSIEMPFEMLTIPVPSNYESILNKTYGAWREFVVGRSVHRGVIFDTDVPYTEYLK